MSNTVERPPTDQELINQFKNDLEVFVRELQTDYPEAGRVAPFLNKKIIEVFTKRFKEYGKQTELGMHIEAVMKHFKGL
ncbi:MAG TPA: hypothetical protein VJ836_00705 [Candidatus Saccharimonadales bacterium]|nr:hypothetical protein [Candidatus Saccharimonadales bacterium]